MARSFIFVNIVFDIEMVDVTGGRIRSMINASHNRNKLMEWCRILAWDSIRSKPSVHICNDKKKY